MDDQWSPSPAAGSPNYNKAALLRALVPLAAPRYLSITYVKRQLYKYLSRFRFVNCQLNTLMEKRVLLFGTIIACAPSSFHIYFMYTASSIKKGAITSLLHGIVLLTCPCILHGALSHDNHIYRHIGVLYLAPCSQKLILNTY